MKLGEPQVSLQALADLDRVLKDHGLRQVFSDDATVIEEACDESATAPRHRKTTLPVQHDVGKARVDADERRGATAMILRLAQLILQAGGIRSWRLAMTNVDLPASLLRRRAVVYVRQSTPAQVQLNRESQRRQYELVEEARRRGFRDVEVVNVGLD